MHPDDLRDLFAPFRTVSVRRMFGGAGIYADGVMFALLSSRGTLYLKADENSEGDFVRENLPRALAAAQRKAMPKGGVRIRKVKVKRVSRR